MDYLCGRKTFKWPFKGYLFFVQSVQDKGEEDGYVNRTDKGCDILVSQLMTRVSRAGKKDGGNTRGWEGTMPNRV